MSWKYVSLSFADRRYTDEGKKEIPAEEEGPISDVDISDLKKSPPPLPSGFEWCTVDLTDETEGCASW